MICVIRERRREVIEETWAEVLTLPGQITARGFSLDDDDDDGGGGGGGWWSVLVEIQGHGYSNLSFWFLDKLITCIR